MMKLINKFRNFANTPKNNHIGHCILQRVQRCKYKTYLTCETLHIAQIVNTESCNIIYPSNMVCFRYIIVKTLHKGNNKDNNSNNNNNVKW